MSRVTAIVLGVWCASWLVVTAGQQTAPAVYLPNLTVVDGTGGRPQAAMTIVVRDGRIVDLFPTGDREPPPDAQALPTDGRYVIPGLIDTHVHLAATDRPSGLVSSLLRATMMGGVTTVRDMGGNSAVVAGFRDAARVNSALSPTIQAAALFAGPDAFWFTDPARAGFLNGGGEPGAMPWLARIDGRTDIRGAVRRAKAWGADGIAVYSHLDARQVRSIANEARREGLAVWGRGTVGPARPRDLVDARVSTLSHAETLVWQGRTDVTADQVDRPAALAEAIAAVPADDPEILDLLGRMRERDVALEPTLFALAQEAAFATTDRPQVDRRAAWAAAVTNRARQVGVMVVTGTDAIGGSSPNLHVELQLLVDRAGFSPLQALRAATFDAARAIGLAADVGSIAIGRRADLVILARNPVDDIRNTQAIVMVMRGGVMHELAEPMPAPPLALAPGR